MRAFTLVELLVVITIIVVLLSLLAPAMDKAMESAVRTVCAARMRALQVSVNLYTMDHKRWLPAWLEANETQVAGVNTGQRNHNDDSFWWWKLHTFNYIRDHDLPGWRYEPGPSTTRSPFACPDAANFAENGNNPNLLPQWIAYNIFLGFDNANPPGSYWDPYRRVRMSRVTMPQLTFMFGDGHRSALNSGAGVHGDYILSFNPTTTEAGYANTTKHQGAANYVFIDGHTETLAKEEAEDRADAGRTGWNWTTEHFFLPFAHPRDQLGR